MTSWGPPAAMNVAMVLASAPWSTSGSFVDEVYEVKIKRVAIVIYYIVGGCFATLFRLRTAMPVKVCGGAGWHKYTTNIQVFHGGTTIPTTFLYIDYLVLGFLW